MIVALVLVSSDEDLSTTLFVPGEAELLEPRGRSTTLAAIESSENGGTEFDWTIVGSIYNPETGLDSLAWWESAGEDLKRWKLNVSENVITTSQRFNDIAAVPGLQIAVGSVGSGLDIQGSAWYRTQSGEWQQANLSNIESADELLKVGISTNGRIVAIGQSQENQKETYKAWTSLNAISYEEVDISFPENVDLVDVAANSRGFTIIGLEETEGNKINGRVWVSSDGINWRTSPVENFSGESDVILSAVEASESSFVIVGGVERGSTYIPAAWVSSDLETWRAEGVSFEEGEDDRRTSTGGQFALGVAASEDGFVAFSSVPFLQQVWRSTDGRGWVEVGYIRGHRATGVPVLGAAIKFSEDNRSVQAVAITRDAGIWTFDTSSSWSELSFPPEGTTVLPRIEDSPNISQVVWDYKRERFLAGGTFSHAEGNESQTTSGARFWASEDQGKTWSFETQFHRRDVGGPVSRLASSPAGVAAVGVQDLSLAISAAENEGDNPNPLGLFWHLHQDAGWLQSRPFPNPQTYPYTNLNILQSPDLQNIFISSTLTAIAPLKQGYVIGGWAFYPGALENVDGLAYITENNQDFTLIPREAIGLDSDEDDIVSAICVREAADGGEDTIALFGVIAEDFEQKITAAYSTDSGENWEVAESQEGAFDEFRAQEVFDCAAVPRQLCDNPSSIFASLSPCQGEEERGEGKDFFLAVGRASSEGESDARAWWSSNGERWELLNLPSELSSGGDQQLLEILISPDNRLILVGNDNSSGISRGQLWMEGGGEWELLPTGLENHPLDIIFTSAAINPEGYMVIAGQEDGRQSRFWHSRTPVF